MKSVTFTGTRGEVQSKALEWKMANPQARIVADCMPTAAWDMNRGPEAPHNESIWTCAIQYEDAPSN